MPAKSLTERLPPGFPVGCEDTGYGRPLVLLHCSGADRHHWKRLLSALGPGGYGTRRIIRPELFGCGETAPWPDGRAVTLDDYVALVATALQDLDEPFDLVGHSMGGVVALKLALAMPARLRTLTVIEPVAFFLLRGQGPDERALLSEAVAIGDTIRRGAASDSDDARQHAMECFVDYWNGPGRWRMMDKATRGLMAKSLKSVSEDYFAVLSERNILDELAMVDVPTLLIGGTVSPEPVRHILKQLTRVLPDATPVSVPGASHMLPLTHAPLVADLLAGFFERHSSVIRRPANPASQHADT